MRVGKRAQPREVAGARLLHHAQHQSDDALAGRRFDLRQKFAYIERVDQLAQRIDEARDARIERLAAVHVGDVGVALFAKAHQHGVLLNDEFDR